MNEMTSQVNPLLHVGDFPCFRDVTPEHIESALDEILRQNRDQIKQLLTNVRQPDWDNFIRPMEALDDRLEKMWAPVSHLNNVMNNKQLQASYQACLPRLSDYAAELGQNKALFEKIRAVKENLTQNALNESRPDYQAMQRSLENDLRDFSLSGIDLEPEQQERFKVVSSELSELMNQFSQNVQDATDGWSLHIDDQEDLAGLPDNVITLAKEQAQSKEKSGWLFTLQYPFYAPFMSYADNSALREEMYRAFVTRASDVGPTAGTWDNTEIMASILALRDEKARLLGFDHYAQYSLETKMARDVDEVESFLLQLAESARPGAEKEVAELERFAKEEYGIDRLNPWDYGWYSEKLRQKNYDFSQEALRPYFPLPRVLEGMFGIVGQLFNIQVREAEAPDTWHEDVLFFEIEDECAQTRGFFFVDLYARESKQGGAWMADAVGRRRTEQGIQLPVAFLTCNFSRPLEGSPSLLTHDEVITLFHEFGHGLHHLLTKVEVAGVAGINGVAWDAVELPSQFLENWCWDKEALDLISGHVETGETIPDELLSKMHQAKNFQSAMQMLRQIEFSLFDLRVHQQNGAMTGAQIQRILDLVRDEVAVIKAPDFNRFQHGFGHIFAGGYAAGYYSYKWAEVLSADAFSLFEENGIFDRQTGLSFRSNILEKGGSEDPEKLFFDFRGRAPDTSALLRHNGLGPNIS